MPSKSRTTLGSSQESSSSGRCNSSSRRRKVRPLLKPLLLEDLSSPLREDFLWWPLRSSPSILWQHRSPLGHERKQSTLSKEGSCHRSSLPNHSPVLHNRSGLARTCLEEISTHCTGCHLGRCMPQTALQPYRLFRIRTPAHDSRQRQGLPFQGRSRHRWRQYHRRQHRPPVGWQRRVASIPSIGRRRLPGRRWWPFDSYLSTCCPLPGTIS
jgi:hypothetical protein